MTDYDTPAQQPAVLGRDATKVFINPMQLSDGRTDYFVCIRVGQRSLEIHKLPEEYQAEYTAAELHWLLHGGKKPDLMAYNKNGWPARPAPEAPALDPGTEWQPIVTRPDSNDLMWFCRGDTFDGPREPEYDDVDRWDYWCLALPPQLPDDDALTPRSAS